MSVVDGLAWPRSGRHGEHSPANSEGSCPHLCSHFMCAYLTSRTMQAADRVPEVEGTGRRQHTTHQVLSLSLPEHPGEVVLSRWVLECAVLNSKSICSKDFGQKDTEMKCKRGGGGKERRSKIYCGPWLNIEFSVSTNFWFYLPENVNDSPPAQGTIPGTWAWRCR